MPLATLVVACEEGRIILESHNRRVGRRATFSGTLTALAASALKVCAQRIDHLR